MMQISLHKPLAFSELGQRQNNEDCIFPAIEQKDNHQKLFMVCDGVGGMEKGEVASQLVCEVLSGYFQQNPTKNIDADYINEGLAIVQQAFIHHQQENPATKGMASTLTLLAIHEGGITVAHVGDSRVYHIRDGQILYKTTDHSLVNQLLEQEIITPEEAIGHPQRNVIVRAMQAERKVKADVQLITDIKPNDYFLLCTDGVLEHLDEATLCTILAQEYSNEEKIEAIKNYGKDINKDNFSAYLLCVANVTTIEEEENSIANTSTTMAETKEVVTEENINTEKTLLQKIKNWFTM
jgi:protein phosphatase